MFNRPVASEAVSITEEISELPSIQEPETILDRLRRFQAASDDKELDEEEKRILWGLRKSLQPLFRITNIQHVFGGGAFTEEILNKDTGKTEEVKFLLLHTRFLYYQRGADIGYTLLAVDDKERILKLQAWNVYADPLYTHFEEWTPDKDIAPINKDILITVAKGIEAVRSRNEGKSDAIADKRALLEAMQRLTE